MNMMNMNTRRRDSWYGSLLMLTVAVMVMDDVRDLVRNSRKLRLPKEYIRNATCLVLVFLALVFIRVMV